MIAFYAARDGREDVRAAAERGRCAERRSAQCVCVWIAEPAHVGIMMRGDARLLELSAAEKTHTDLHSIFASTLAMSNVNEMVDVGATSVFECR